MDKLVESFLNENFTNNATYEKRVDAATKLYEEFYATNREKMSTHFRMLYQLVHFISNAQYIDTALYLVRARDSCSASAASLWARQFNASSLSGVTHSAGIWGTRL